MQYRIQTSRGETAVLQFSGRIETRIDETRLERVLKAFTSGEYNRVELDLGTVTYISPLAIELLLGAEAIGRRRETSVTIINATQAMRDLLFYTSPPVGVAGERMMKKDSRANALIRASAVRVRFEARAAE